MLEGRVGGSKRQRGAERGRVKERKEIKEKKSERKADGQGGRKAAQTGGKMEGKCEAQNSRERKRIGVVF